ncbi:hypothetical protein GCM10023091_43010 [Ravibacter arvi]|uniref:Uncharacterized protein n=1 Tax=Ravibacter arvi TaxID=2051041 RepID=A0ABP8MDP7_9BACT
MTITRLTYIKYSGIWSMHVKEYSGKRHQMFVDEETAKGLLEADFIRTDGMHFEDYRFVKSRSISESEKAECEKVRLIINRRKL